MAKSKKQYSKNFVDENRIYWDFVEAFEGWPEPLKRRIHTLVNAWEFDETDESDQQSDTIQETESLEQTDAPEHQHDQATPEDDLQDLSLIVRSPKTQKAPRT